METRCSVMIGHFNKMDQPHIRIIYLNNGVMIIFLLLLTKTTGLQIPQDLNPLDYSIWDELVHQIKWNKCKSKLTLIQELKRAVKNFRVNVALES